MILPAAGVPASALGFVMKPTPLWLGVAAMAVALTVMGVRQLMSRSHWYRF